MRTVHIVNRRLEAAIDGRPLWVIIALWGRPPLRPFASALRRFDSEVAYRRDVQTEP